MAKKVPLQTFAKVRNLSEHRGTKPLGLDSTLHLYESKTNGKSGLENDKE